MRIRLPRFIAVHLVRLTLATRLAYLTELIAELNDSIAAVHEDFDIDLYAAVNELEEYRTIRNYLAIKRDMLTWQIEEM